MPSQSSHVPKFGDWDMDGASGQQQAFTLIFDNMRTDKSTKRVNPNDPAFLAEYFDSSSSSSSQSVVHDADSTPPASLQHESPPHPRKPTSGSYMNQKNQSPAHVPKFGDWGEDGESGGQQPFTLIFDNVRADKSMKGVNPNDPAFLAKFFNPSSSSSSQATVNDADAAPPPSSLHGSPPRPLKPNSRLPMHAKQSESSHVPKFGDWDVDGVSGQQQAFTVIFDNMRTHKSTKRVNPNDPAFLAEYFNSSSSSSSRSVVHDADSMPPPPSQNESPPHPRKPTSGLSTNQKNQSAPAHVPKFGDWGVDGEGGGQQPFTLIFDNMRADKSMKGVNPNDPEFLAKFFNPPSSSSSQAIVHDPDAASPPSSSHGSPPHPLNPTSGLPLHPKNQSVHLSKFGDGDVDREKGGKQSFALNSNKKHADLAYSSSSSSSSQAATHDMSQATPVPLRHHNPKPSFTPTSRLSTNHKSAMAPAFGHWDVEHPQEYTVIFDELKEEKRLRHVSTHHGSQASTSPTTPLPPQRPSLMSWRLCFSGRQAVRE